MSMYDRITFRGHTMDRVTARAVRHVDYCLSHLIDRPVTVRVAQGCYSTAVGASAGTHAGSGAVDLFHLPGIATDDQIRRAGRLAGWAMWHRLPCSEWDEHFHGILIGDARVSDAARRQVQDYYAHLTGLADHAKDLTWHPSPIVAFHYPMHTVNLDHVAAQFRHPTTRLPGVARIQRALNLKTGTTLRTDGWAGPLTRSALGRWERQNGGNGDGIPGERLWLLGVARFEVVS